MATTPNQPNPLGGDDFIKRGEEIKNIIEDTRSATRELNRELRAAGGTAIDFGGTYSSIRRSADQVAAIQREATKSVKGTAMALKEQERQQDNVKKLNAQIAELYKASRAAAADPELQAALIAQAQSLETAKDQAQGLVGLYGEMAAEAANLDKSAQYFDALGETIGDIPGLSAFKGAFADASKSARAIRVEGGSGLDAFKGGSKALMEGIGGTFTKLLGPAGFVFGIIKAIQFFISLLVSAQKNTVEIARNMSTTRESADAVRKSFIDVAKNTSLTAANSETLLKAQKELADVAGITNVQSAATLVNQVRLTTRLGLNADEAAKFNFAFEALGQNAEKGLDTIIATENSLRKATGTGVNLGAAISDASKAGGQFLANTKGGMAALTAASLEAKRLGINLEQSKKMSAGLLDFESSIQNELEAELLTGKQLNLELAREKALRGDNVGAAKELLSQVGSYEDFQNMSVLSQNALAKSMGMTSDELADALLLQTNTNRQKQEYLRLLQEQGSAEAKKFADQVGLAQVSRDELDKTVSIQQAFQESLAKAKDQFTGLVNSGTLDKFVDLMSNFINVWQTKGLISAIFNSGGGPDKSPEAEAERRLATIARSSGRASDRYKEAMQDYQKQGYTISKDGKVSKKAEDKEIPADDFTIRTNPKDTLVMAGGTKLGAGVEERLDKLIELWSGGVSVYMNSEKVSDNLVRTSRALGTR